MCAWQIIVYIYLGLSSYHLTKTPYCLPDTYISILTIMKAYCHFTFLQFCVFSFCRDNYPECYLEVALSYSSQVLSYSDKCIPVNIEVIFTLLLSAPSGLIRMINNVSLQTVLGIQYNGNSLKTFPAGIHLGAFLSTVQTVGVQISGLLLLEKGEYNQYFVLV